jgi:hypothetical protein
MFPILNGCIGRGADALKVREEYIICSFSNYGAKEFKDYIISFARKEEMNILDRGAEAEMELRELKKGGVVLDSTAGELILLTVEHENRVRISITNAGLGKDLNLTFRYISKPRPDEVTKVLQFAEQKYHVIPISGNRQGARPCES